MKTISQKTILYYALETVMQRLDYEREMLKKNPDDSIAKHRIEKHEAQWNEIREEILKIEKEEIRK